MMNYTPKHPFGARCEHVYTSTTSQGQRVGGISRRSTHRYGVSHATRSLLHYGQIDFRVYSSLRFGAAAVGALVDGVACRLGFRRQSQPRIGSAGSCRLALALRVCVWKWELHHSFECRLRQIGNVPSSSSNPKLLYIHQSCRCSACLRFSPLLSVGECASSSNRSACLDAHNRHFTSEIFAKLYSVDRRSVHFGYF